MNQARGRYSGSRDSGQRPPRHVKKSPSNRQSQPYVKGHSPRDEVQTASIFKTRSFQLLVEAVGAENIALGLESNLTRVAELMKGEKFTPETAFHMETTLGLPHGFFDQPNPVLTPETVARLKSPLDFVQTEPESEEEVFEVPSKPASAQVISQQPSIKEHLPEESEMLKKAAGASPRAVQNNKNTTVVQPAAGKTPKGRRVKSETVPQGGHQQSLALNNSAAVQNIRRANLHVLTSRNGSKARLAAVMELTGSNMAHRLHGKKRMDDAEANRFTERLGLPTGWLDTPRSEAEIPDSMSQLLVPASRAKASQTQRLPVTAIEESPEADVDVENMRSSPAPASTSAEQSPHISTSGAVDETVVVGEQARTSNPPAELAAPAIKEKSAALPPAAPEQVATTSDPQRHSLSHRPTTSLTSLANLDGIEPIAEALIKTLAGKARAGKLDEFKALELLQQAVLL
ncbi:hypothetical protein [Caballeronia humi]|uniref:Uncharacterized protein n=1 Tax=Caballeronia humi TaxID=326474 RepID=A0A158JKP2_9BURK|nr:hypothetical protein [Caballeronia humi]SAL69041.1 hypothetical protein AWB65_06785 [Caballeronia humi]